MTDPLSLPPFPQAATMEQIRDYADWHCQQGRGKYYPEVRAMYFVIPPTGDTHDDDEKKCFFRGVY